MSSPTARTLAECRRRGWTAQVVEHYNKYARKKFDLFGCIDIVAITTYEGHGSTDPRILGIQATTGAHHANRIAKITDEPRMKLWLLAGGKLEVWSWSLQGGRGKRKKWTLRVEEIGLICLMAGQLPIVGVMSDDDYLFLDGGAK